MKRFALLYMVFLLCWFGGMVAAVQWLGASSVEALGMGVAGGVFVSEFRIVVGKIVDEGHAPTKAKETNPNVGS